VSKEEKEKCEGLSPSLNVEVERPEERPRSETKSKEEKRSFFGQRCNSNEEKGVQYRGASQKNDIDSFVGDFYLRT